MGVSFCVAWMWERVELTCSAVMGSSSAVGVASMKSLRMGMSKSSDAQAMKRFKSTLLMDPIGLISAEEPIRC